MSVHLWDSTGRTCQMLLAFLQSCIFGKTLERKEGQGRGNPRQDRSYAKSKLSTKNHFQISSLSYRFSPQFLLLHVLVKNPSPAFDTSKTYHRNTTGVGKLNGHALMQAHRDIPINLEEVIDLFTVRQSRRMKLKDILADPSD